MPARSNSKHPSPTHEYPRPQLVRPNWTSLNGKWDFAIDADAAWSAPSQVKWNRTIIVPFAPETPASGVNETGFFQQVWYRRKFEAPTLRRNQRLMLHFGAVDYRARVWVNGRLAVEHEGGYTPFSADITDLLTSGRQQVVEVAAHDDPHDLYKPRGKQDWQRQPHSIWYHRTTGIWQTVWLEVVPETRIQHLAWIPNVNDSQMRLRVHLAGPYPDKLRMRVRLDAPDCPLADEEFAVAGRDIDRAITLQPPRDHVLRDLLWSPEHPRLIDAKLELLDHSGKVLDSVASYCALRTIEVEGDQILLNRRRLYLRMALDQGYWEESGLTAPSDAALRRDVELARDMGFNGVRKHQKIEDPRYLYWADRLGLLVWEEMPSPMRFSTTMVQRISREWAEAIQRDVSHPCIICWVPFNESWGVDEVATDPVQRDAVRALYYQTRAMDPTRPCIGNEGWEMIIGDIIGVHNYARDPRRLLELYDIEPEDVEKRLRESHIGGRLFLTPDTPYSGQPVVLTEFGGIGYSRHSGTWGYYTVSSEQELAEKYTQLLEAVRRIPIFSGFCYTQFTDTYQEANGLLYMDRTPKFPIEQICKATRG